MNAVPLEYELHGQRLIGRLALPEGDGQVPGLLIAHGAPGLDEFIAGIPGRVAALGYAALAIDYHGDGRVLRDPAELQARMGELDSDPDAVRALGSAGLDALRAHERVDPARVAALGYCYGAVVAMELARTGADLRAIVGFHPGLSSPRPEDSRNIIGQVLMCVGADDALVPAEQRRAFEDEMRAAGVSWQLNIYSGAKHRFTDPRAGDAGAPELAYHQLAAARAWAAMTALLAEVFV